MFGVFRSDGSRILEGLVEEKDFPLVAQALDSTRGPNDWYTEEEEDGVITTVMTSDEIVNELSKLVSEHNRISEAVGDYDAEKVVLETMSAYQDYLVEKELLEEGA
jgi:hypothetical protein